MLPVGDQDEVELSSTSPWSPTGSRQHRRCFIPQAVNTVKCSWVWAKLSPKHAELIEIINKVTIVASSWLFILL